jgi:acyl-CoA synthetase (AMP-forming)/AMP-acid ligase II
MISTVALISASEKFKQVPLVGITSYNLAEQTVEVRRGTSKACAVGIPEARSGDRLVAIIRVLSHVPP